MTADTTAARAGRREWIALAVLGLPTLLVSLDVGALFLALPSLSADLGASAVQQLWITDVYGFLEAGLLITMGTLGDRIGRRRLLLAGAAAFGACSVLAAFAPSPGLLIAARALLGVAGATLMPSTLALIRTLFRDPGQRATAVAAWVSCMMSGAALGPVAGGLLLERFWWGSVFLLGVPAMVLLLAVGPFLLPEDRDPGAGRPDLLSVGLSLGAILPVVYGVKELAAGAPAQAAAGVVLGALCGVVFVRRQLRLTDPLLDLRLFADWTLSVTCAAMLAVAAAMAGTFLLVSQYVQTVERYGPGWAGLWLAPAGLAVAAGSQLAAAAARRWPERAVVTGGLLLGAAGFVLLAATGGTLPAMTGIVLVHLGAGPLFALGAHQVVTAAPATRAGSAASLSELSNNLGATLGLALLGSIGMAVYRHRMAGPLTRALAGGDVPPPARQSLAGARQAARGLPAGPAADLMSAAGTAFTAGLHLAAVIGAVVFTALAALLWRRPAAHESAGRREDPSAGRRPPGEAQAGSPPVRRTPSTRRGMPGPGSRSSGGRTAGGASCQATGRRNRRIAVAPTDVCSAFVVDGYGPPCCIPWLTATPVGKPFQISRPAFSRSALASRSGRPVSSSPACTVAVRLPGRRASAPSSSPSSAYSTTTATGPKHSSSSGPARSGARTANSTGERGPSPAASRRTPRAPAIRSTPAPNASAIPALSSTVPPIAATRRAVSARSRSPAAPAGTNARPGLVQNCPAPSVNEAA